VDDGEEDVHRTEVGQGEEGDRLASADMCRNALS
jgi:hypothetical protein